MKILNLLVIGIALVAVTLTGCADKKGQALKTDTERLAFAWYVNYDWWSPPNAWGKDPVSEYLQSDKKLDITWGTPSGSGADKLNLMIASGDLPDIITMDRGATVTKMIEAGLLLPLDPYLDKMPNLKKYVGNINIELLRHTDGKLYTFPNWYLNPDSTSGNGSAAWAVNSKIYNELKRPSLATYEDLEAYLLLVKQQYPDIIPMEACDGFQAADLVYLGEDIGLHNYFSMVLGTPENGEFTPVFKDPRVRDSLLYLRELFAKNLITKDAFTQTRDQVMEKLVNGRVAVTTVWDISMLRTANSLSKVQDNLYEIVWPPVKKGIDSSKVTLSTFSTLGWNVNVFTKNSADRIERILETLDWLTGEEGQIALCYGPKGYFWDELDEFGYPKWNATYEKATQAVRDEARTFMWNWVGNTSWVDTSKVIANRRIPLEQQDIFIKYQGDIVWKTSRAANDMAYDRAAPDSDVGIIETIARDIFDETKVRVVFAKSAYEAKTILDEAQAELDANGYQQYLAFNTNSWKNRIKLLNKVTSEN